MPEPILDRALAFLTEDLEALDAAQLRATARCAPLWAARCGYALGYLEGSEDRQTLAADERHSLEHIVAGVRARLARALAGGPEGAPREVGVPQREGGR